MILQSKAHLEDGVSRRRRMFAKSLGKFRERHRVGKRIDRGLVNDSHVFIKRAIPLHLTAQRNDAGKISHRLADILAGSV